MTGSWQRFAVGAGMPLALLILLVNAVDGGSDVPRDLASRLTTPTVFVQTAGTRVEQAPAANPASPVVSATSTPGRSQLTYVVKSGDTLGAICATHVPALPLNDCVAAIVNLNKLAGPDQLAVGQSLALPAGASTSAPAPAAATPAGQAAVPVTASTPAPTATRAATQAAPQTGIRFTSLSSPVKPGQEATLTASVPPGASCMLKYAPPPDTPNPTTSILAKIADDRGNVSWSWNIPSNTKKGRGVVVVSCGAIEMSAFIDVS